MTRRLPGYLVPLVLAAGAVGGAAVAREQSARREARDADDARAMDRALAGLVPGRASSCLPANATRSASSRIYGSSIVYTVSRGLKYRSDTNVPCSARPNADLDVLVTQTPIGQTCSGDPVRVVDRYTGALRGVCSFGPFIPYRRP